MKDRELLQLAAMAVGYTLKEHCDVRGQYWPWCVEIGDYWNPLRFDGEALRLAVKLRMDITFNTENVFAFPPCGLEGSSTAVSVDDPYAATRRVIVTAAAEIGRKSRGRLRK